MATALVEPKARITARVTHSVQSMLEEAAAFMGVPLNSFLVSAAVEKAGDVLAKERIIKLGQQDTERFVQMMENPPEPNAYLLKAMAEVKSRVRE
jgi:uncharacterized protein (DUF1778 family)